MRIEIQRSGQSKFRVAIVEPGKAPIIEADHLDTYDQARDIACSRGRYTGWMIFTTVQDSAPAGSYLSVGDGGAGVAVTRQRPVIVS